MWFYWILKSNIWNMCKLVKWKGTVWNSKLLYGWSNISLTSINLREKKSSSSSSSSSFLRIWSYLLKKSLVQNFIFCAVNVLSITGKWSKNKLEWQKEPCTCVLSLFDCEIFLLINHKSNSFILLQFRVFLLGWFYVSHAFLWKDISSYSFMNYVSKKVRASLSGFQRLKYSY